jgi:protein TonB
MTFSLVFHLTVVSVALVTSPFEHEKMDFGEVIKVRLTAPSELQRSTPQQAPIAVPQPKMQDDFVEIPLDDPRTVKTKKEVKKPEKKKEPDKKEEPKTTTQTAQPEQKEIETSTTASGQMFAGATVSNETFNYPYWFDQAFNKIYANFRSPVTSDEPIIATIYFEVIQSGRLLDVKVISSSGIERFDDACIMAIQRAAPFPPLPRDFRDEIIGITLPIKFDEQ